MSVIEREMVSLVILNLKNVICQEKPIDICSKLPLFLVSALNESCPKLKILDMSNSKFDDCIADLLCGVKEIIKKGNLIKILKVRQDKHSLFKDNLILLDLRFCKQCYQGLSTLQSC